MTNTTNATQRTNPTATVIRTISQARTRPTTSNQPQRSPSRTRLSSTNNQPSPTPTTNTTSSSNTNMVVRSVEAACAFYTQAFGWTIVTQDSTSAILQYNNDHFYLVAEQAVSEYFGYTAVSPQTSGHSSAMTTTLICDDVENTWNNALQAGAIPVKSPFKKSNGCYCATLVGPDNYIWFITNNSNFFTV
jgi:predicted enzyme related to lactoylglutathione lyase